MSSPYDHHFWQLRELQRALDLVRPQLEMELAQTMPPSIRDKIEQFNAIQERFTLPSDYLAVVDDVQRALHGSFSLEHFRMLNEIQDPVFEQLRNNLAQVDSTASVISDAVDFYSPVSEVMLESLTSVEALLETSRIASEEVSSLLAPQVAFQRFVSEQLEMLGGPLENLEAQYRSDVLTESSGILEDLAKSLELGALMRGEAPLPGTSPDALYLEPLFETSSSVFAGIAAKVENIDFEDPETPAKDLVSNSCEARIASLGHRLVRLVHDMNEEAEREGAEVPFKPTTRTLLACGTLSAVSATDEISFGIVVDQLYFLLYEATGEAKRLIVKAGDEALEALWRLKHLRLNTRHDIAHGKQKEIIEKQMKVGQAFKDLIGVVSPRLVSDWCKAQVVLYEQLIEMLERIWYGDDEEYGSVEPSAREDV